jgi:predicted hotdog family 3-hydroxylacyl-ACP dehydratase
MCLLDEIVAWDETTVHALARRHASPEHPLRRGGELPIAAGIEYGAQAAAAHGALVGADARSTGFLASVRSVEFNVRRLDDVTAPLEILAEEIGHGDFGVLYRFEVSAEGRCLVGGRVAVAFPR